jgi:hypothetical protein
LTGVLSGRVTLLGESNDLVSPSHSTLNFTGFADPVVRVNV